MNADKVIARPTVTNPQVPRQPEPIFPAGPKVASRHRSATNDLYSYQGYKTWMHNARENWKDV
jgi:hypothetical protein